MDTHLILSVYIIKVMGRNQIHHFRGNIQWEKKSKYQAFRGQKKKKKKNKLWRLKTRIVTEDNKKEYFKERTVKC